MSSDPFYDDESSHQDSRPLEYFTIEIAGTTWRHATGKRDLLVSETDTVAVYTAIATGRDDVAVPDTQTPTNMTLYLPVNHDFVKRWFVLGVPPQRATVTFYRKQVRSGVAEVIWYGIVQSLAVDKSEAKVLVTPTPMMWATKRLPTVSTAWTCPYQTYDSMCQVDRATFTFTTTTQAVNGRDLVVDMVDLSRIGYTPGLTRPWAEGGVLLHVPSGQQMAIRTQTDFGGGGTLSKLSLQAPVFGMTNGESVQITAGDAHDVQTCKNKFNNVKRFGGYPYAPSANPFIPGGSGLK